MDGTRSTASFADRLNYLFATVYPPDRKPFSNPEVAAAITGSGVNISAAYLWLLRTGQRDNPTMRHLDALARFFGVPPAYFFDDETASEVAEQLELLRVAQDADVREIMLRSTELSPLDRSTVLGIVRRFARDSREGGAETGR